MSEIVASGYSVVAGDTVVYTSVVTSTCAGNYTFCEADNNGKTWEASSGKFSWNQVFETETCLLNPEEPDAINNL